MRPETPWLDTARYPFRSRFFTQPRGEMHYIDEGEGPVLVFVHGNPTWSFTWRHLIAAFRRTHRCVAMDHLGFGLSDKPGEPMSPAEHAENLTRLLDHLQVDRVTLVVEDWGGPIGFSWALQRAERLARAVVFNSWLWSVRGDPHFERFSGLMGGRFGRFLTRRLNFFARFVLPKAVGVPLPREVWRHYRAPLSSAEARAQCAHFPTEIIGASAWLGALWAQRESLAEVPALMLWGGRDIAFREQELARWGEIFPHARIRRLSEAGHAPQETHPVGVVGALRSFLGVHALTHQPSSDRACA